MHSVNWKNLFGLCIHTYFFNLFLFLLLNFNDNSSATSVMTASSVKFLPGFDGPLPFELETGYIGVGESEDIQLFYYFIKSESNPAKDPLMLWFTGGPGCSSLYGLLYEIGPIRVQVQSYDERFPEIVLNPFSWTKFANIVFIDLPEGTGFSYRRNRKTVQPDDLQSSNHGYEFFRKWLVDHPQFISHQVYVGGDSYSGITVPIITQLISDGNDIGLEPKINLMSGLHSTQRHINDTIRPTTKRHNSYIIEDDFNIRVEISSSKPSYKGYVLGNPKSTPDEDDYIPFAHGMGLIPDELFESLKETCRGKFHDIDPKNSLCLQNMKKYKELIEHIHKGHILEPSCKPISSASWQRKLSSGTETIHKNYHSNLQKLEIHKDGSPIQCRYAWYGPFISWANDKNVQEAIHIRKGTVDEWQRCKTDFPYTKSVPSSVPYHANLSVKGYRSLIYSGDHDFTIPFMSTEVWIKSLNYSIVDDWRPWIVDGQVAGYTRTYANKMTFATVKGAGHTAPEYKPIECVAMFRRWISDQPL